MTLDAYFDSVCKKQVLSFIGCGGKTSLMWSLANIHRDKKVLVTTTTHIHKPEAEKSLFDHFIQAEGFNTSTYVAAKGISLAGSMTSGKFGSLPPDILENTIPHFDYCYIEADGSRSKPLKAWAAYEPVITDSTTITVGILPITVLSLPVSDTVVHRLPLWLQLCGAKEGQLISIQNIADTVCGTNGKSLFSAAIGKKILFFNRVETKADFTAAKEIAAVIKNKYADKPDDIIAGSVFNNTAEVI